MAYADYLEKEKVEFFAMAHNHELDETYAIMSSNAAILLGAIFMKSPEVYELFKEAETRAGLGPEYNITITPVE